MRCPPSRAATKFLPPPTVTSTSRATLARPTPRSATCGTRSTRPTSSLFTTTTSRARRCTASASATSAITGCASTSRASIAATPSSSATTATSAVSALRPRHERVHGRHQELARPRQRLLGHLQHPRLHALPRRAASASPRLTVDGLKDINVPQNSFFFGADTHPDQLRLGAVRGPRLRHHAAVRGRSRLPLCHLGDARSGVVTAYDFSSSYSASHQLQDITSNDLLLAVRYKLQRDEPVAYAVK